MVEDCILATHRNQSRVVAPDWEIILTGDSVS
jgi:hypothetical protein